MIGGGLFQLIAFGKQDIYYGYSKSSYVHNFNNYTPHHKKTKNIKPEKLREKKYKNYREYDKYNQQKCVLCRDKFKLDEFVIIRKCKHIYHKDCHDKSINKCPICRA